MRVVHLPFYDDNPYQAMLMKAQSQLGVEAIAGGGGGNFLRSALYRWHADVLHFHWLHPYMLRKGWTGSLLRSLRFCLELLLIRLAGKRLVWTMHNLSSHESLHPLLERKMLRWTLPLFHCVICHSRFAQSQAISELGIPSRRIRVIPHANYVEQYEQCGDRQESRQTLGILDDRRVYLFLGRVAAYKGVGDLVDAFGEVAAANDLLVIAGKESEPGAFSLLRDATSHDERIRLFEGYVPQERVPTFLAAADVVVFPFRQVLTSGSVILAMSLGRACIAPRLGGIPELGLDDSLLFDPQSTDGLAETLRASRDLNLDAIGERNLQLVQSWDCKTIAGQTLESYKERETQL